MPQSPYRVHLHLLVVDRGWIQRLTFMPEWYMISSKVFLLAAHTPLDIEDLNLRRVAKYGISCQHPRISTFL
jgi:hypothetical protein